MDKLKINRGDRFGRLVIMKETKYDPVGRSRMFQCKCDCGNKKIIPLSRLRNGDTKSCGCIKKELDKTRTLTHGMSSTKIYGTWLRIRKRCRNKNDKDFHLYGGRGIKVCNRWLNSFENFYEDMHETHKDGLTIERIDNNKGYFKSNCKWVPMSEQGKNTRRCIFFKGESASKAGLRIGGSVGLVSGRIRRGWTMEDAFSKPKYKNQHR